VASLTERTASAVLEALGKRLWGFAPGLMPEIVAQLGPARALAWFVRNMPRYEQTRSELGALRTHLLALEISLLNGCPYCTFGHALAFELLYLKQHDQLFPVDEHGFVALHGSGEALLERRLREALLAAGLGDEVPWLERLLELRAGAAPDTAHDARVVHLLEMFSVLNTCGIRGRVAPDQAHDPVNKDKHLKDRYQALRERERLESIPPSVYPTTLADGTTPLTDTRLGR